MVAAIFILLVHESSHAIIFIALDGVQFEEPEGLILSEEKSEPIVSLWRNEENTINVAVMTKPMSKTDSLAMVKEFNNWPDAGRSFVSGFGKSNSLTLEEALDTTCSFVGTPKSRDLNKMAFQVEVETKCKMEKSPYINISRVIQALTKTNMVFIRVDSNPESDKEGQLILANIWHSLKISPEQKIVMVGSDTGIANQTLSVKPVTGGTRVQLVDYSLINTSYLVGKYIGMLISALIFGLLVTIGLTKLKVPPLTSLIVSQVIHTLIQVWVDERNGTWVIDPMLYLVSGTISVLVLRQWARQKMEKTLIPGPRN